MPANPTRDTLSRQWELLKALPSRGPGLTVRELVQTLEERGFPVSKRMVERDLNDLTMVFPIECNDKGIPYGWHWMPGQSADLPGISLVEALSLHIVEELLRPLLPVSLLDVLRPRFLQAEKKLAALAGHNLTARWADKVCQVPPTLPLLPPKIAEGVLEVVQEALLRDVQIEAQYRRHRDEVATAFRLHPLALVQRGPVTYLVATAFDFSDVRLYAVHRMERATPMVEPAQRPSGFNLAAYVASGALQFQSETDALIRFEARVDDGLANCLRETPLSEDVALVPEPPVYRLTASLTETWQLRWWILSQGSGIEVLAPQSLRDYIAQDLEEAAALYRSLPTMLCS